MTTVDLEGRVAVVTGASAGLGRAEAVELAARGASLVLADLADLDATLAEVERAGGTAVGVRCDVGEWTSADRVLAVATDRFGTVDILVNNAGITRDGMIFNLTEGQWDAVLDVHLKGHASMTRAFAAHWRERFSRDGLPVGGRIVNTSSEAALTGNPGQPNYAAAKAGIASLTVSSARALAKYGVTVNAICPRARTGMTQGVFPESSGAGEDPLDPRHVARLVAVLSSAAWIGITGRSFVVYGAAVGVVAPASIEAMIQADDAAFSVEELAAKLAPVAQGPMDGGLADALRRLQGLAGA